MRVLDCGCGPGSITTDLAQIVPSGEIVGIDIEHSQIAAARALAHERGLTNITFEAASIYALPFPDASFDAVLAHTVVEHLREPTRALREIRRVLRYDGLIGVRDGDVPTAVMEPSTPGLRLFLTLWQQVWQHNGGDPSCARHLRRLLREAGFTRTIGSSSAGEQVGSLEASRHLAAVAVPYASAPTFVQTVLEHGWADQAELNAMYADLRAWGEHPDAFYGVLYVEAIGWVGEGEPAPRAEAGLYSTPG
jgi:ubiquinone/menaquinone biosynthesis C-methylase UbiE